MVTYAVFVPCLGSSTLLCVFSEKCTGDSKHQKREKARSARAPLRGATGGPIGILTVAWWLVVTNLFLRKNKRNGERDILGNKKYVFLFLNKNIKFHSFEKYVFLFMKKTLLIHCLKQKHF